MRRSIGAIGMVLSLFSAVPVFGGVEVSKVGSQTIYDITIDGVTLKPTNIGGKDFVAATLKGAGRFGAVRYELGKPEIPVLRLTLDGDVSVEAMDALVQGTVATAAPIKPSQPSWDKNMKFAPPVAFDAASYKVNALTALPSYEISKVASVRGVARNLVTLNAMRYNPATGSYQLQTRYKVTVTARQEKDSAAQPTMAYVVGARFADSPSLATLIQLKERQGFRTRKLVVGQNGLTTDIAIRNALKAILAENVNLRFAVLIGDHTDVPSHDANSISGLTDHFYRAIDTADYESDVNGPDIGVGRISVGTEAQLATVVGKISRYTDGRFGADQWMQHPAFVTTHDRYQVAEGTHNAVIAKHFAPRGYDRSFPDASEKGGDKLYPITLRATPANIVDNMREGRFIINYSGHGSHTGWEDVTTPNVLSLNNPDALPWVISNACITGDFRQEPVFAETWLRHPSGAIVFWGSMDSSYWDEDDILEKGMYDAVFERNMTSFDLIHQAALQEVWRYYGGANKSKYYWETYVTFGDPSLNVRTAKSVEAHVDGPDAIVVGTENTTWHVTTDQGPVAGASVSLRRATDGVTVSGTTDANGGVTLAMGAFGASADTLTLNITGGNLRAVSRDVSVIVANQPYLGFTGWTINGRSGQSGNGAHVGEVAQLAAVVENFGSIATTGGRVKITSIDGPATVTGSEVVIAPLASRERRQIASGLSFAVSAEARRGELIQVHFAWETAEGQSGTASATWPLLRGDIAVESVDYGSNEIEGIGSDGEVFVTVKNIGNDIIRAATLSAQTDACTSRVEGQLEIPELAPGATLRVATGLHVFTDGQCESGSEGRFGLVGTYQGSARQVGLTGQVRYLVGVLENEVERFENLGLAIPDGGSGEASKAIQINGSGPIKDISVNLSIRHTYIGDLVVKLISPDGKAVVLRNREGGSQDDLNQRYGRGGLPIEELKTLIGTEARGEWKITVQDTASTDTGTVEGLELAIQHW